jgi:HSP20 family protein
MHKERRRRSIFELMGDDIEEFDRIMGEMVESVFGRPSWDIESSSFEPLCNVFVAADEVIVTADLPYAKPETTKVEAISEDLIEITAKMKCKKCFEDFGITHRKGEFSNFRCQVRIPVPVDAQRAKASFKRGILEVRLPRKKGYRIKVE